MLFRQNRHDDRGIWIDRGIDGRVEEFQVCPPCNDALLSNDPRGKRWHPPEELCLQCKTDLQVHALLVDLFGLPRPFNTMLEDRVLTNDELEEEPHAPQSGAFDYFLLD